MSREWVDDAKKKPVDKRWVMRCDVISPSGRRCTTESEPVAHQNLLPLERFADEGWFIGAVHGDICPRCLAAGYEPKAIPHRVMETVGSTR